MLIKFYCSNFKSIKDEIAFNMFAGSYKRHENHLIPYQDKNILRTSAIYGTNGSGKTNILLALDFVKKLVVKGTRDINEKLNLPVFKLSDCKDLPSTFEVDFLTNEKRFSYKLKLLANTFLEEELFEYRNNQKTTIFSRKKEGQTTTLAILPNTNKGQKDKLREEIYAEELRDNQSFFNEGVVNKQITEFSEPFNWFKDQLKYISFEDFETNNVGLAATFLEDPDFLRASRSIIQDAKVGILDFKLIEYSVPELKSLGVKFPKKIEEDFFLRDDFSIEFAFEGDLYSSFRKDGEIRFVKISTIHEDINGNSVEFKFDEESKGVQRLFQLLPAIYRTIHKGEVFIIDEIETSFHPVLIKEILNLYVESDPSHSGQIIFTTHESHLLDLNLFRQDEIWFCEKDSNGSTKLYSLSEFKPRFDKDIRKGYLEGQFGYIPFLGDNIQLEL